MTTRKVRIQYDDSNWHAQVNDAETGEPVGKVRSVSFSQSVGEIPIAHLEVIPDEVLLECEAEIYPCHVPAGQKPVAFILQCPEGVCPTSEYIEALESMLKTTGYPLIVLPLGMKLELACDPKDFE